MLFPKKKWIKKSSSGDAMGKLKATLDRWFSKYIRLRDANESGYCQCITCMRWHHWKDIDCGHFVKRNKLTVRYNEKNAHAQCRYCNSFLSGEEWAHGEKIDKLYGAGTARSLQAQGSVRGQKLDRTFYEVMIDTYKKKAKALMKEKNLTTERK
jgi:hypothetical protein